jgi:hypothetical protein
LVRGPYLELFARPTSPGLTRPSWTCWGDEIPRDQFHDVTRTEAPAEPKPPPPREAEPEPPREAATDPQPAAPDDGLPPFLRRPRNTEAAS